VVCYVKNHNLGFTIPYTLNGEEKNYIPDFLVQVRDGADDPLNLIIEVTGEKRKDAVNNHGGFE
jgi:type III restriction enzyme